MFDFIVYSIWATLFWFFQKITDWLNEHWLNFFKWAKYVSGILAWISVFLVIYLSNSPIILSTYLSLLLYWLWLQKVDNNWHMITAFFMLFAMLLNKAMFLWVDVLLLLCSYIIFNYIKKFENIKILKFIFKYKIHFFIIPFAYSVIKWDMYWFSIVFFNLLGTFIANRMFKLKAFI